MKSCIMIAAFVAAWGSSAALAAPVTYQASTVTTEQVLSACRQNPSRLRADLCSGYILGVHDQMSASRMICPPPGASTEQAMAVVVKSLNDHPEQWNRQPATLIAAALRVAFPCRGQSKEDSRRR